jgi:hypothetical protein
MHVHHLLLYVLNVAEHMERDAGHHTMYLIILITFALGAREAIAWFDHAGRATSHTLKCAGVLAVLFVSGAHVLVLFVALGLCSFYVTYC